VVEALRRLIEICGGAIAVAAFIVIITAVLVIFEASMRGEEHMQMAIDFKYPDNPGYKGQLTSKQAARDKKSTKALDQTMVLLALSAAPKGLTADEVAEVYGHIFLKYRPRISELRKMGKIEDSGLRRPSYLGKPQIVWILTEATRMEID